MFQEGKIKTYNAERGFGFIQIEGEKRDLFFHIKDFPNKNVLPEIGETLKFRVVEENGKLKADNIVRLNIQYRQESSPVIGQYEHFAEQSSPRYENSETSKRSKIITFVGLIVLVILAILVYGKYQNYKVNKEQQVQQLILEQQKAVEKQRADLGEVEQIGLSEQGRKNLENTTSQPIKTSTSSTSVSSPYQCDGRTHCSQMRSYEEAVFFINNCPGTKMDGNGDGRPCERQFNR